MPAPGASTAAYAWYQPLTASPDPSPPRVLAALSCRPTRLFSIQPAAMEPFEDDNPFESEPERLQSDSSSSRVNVSGVSSPDLAQPAHLSSPPTSPSRRNTFPSPGSHRQPQAFKSDFCCGRDQWLHSGEDAEILVSLHLGLSTLSLFQNMGSRDKNADLCVDNGCAQNLS